MKIAIISDIHDNVWNLQRALGTQALQTTDTMLCCGDLCSPFIVKIIGQGYRNPVHIVLGNNDGDLAAIIRSAKEYQNIQIHGEYFTGSFGGKTFAMNHYPEKTRILAESGGFDVVCYGHNHKIVPDETVGETLLINPGAIMGYHGGELKNIEATFIVLDTDLLKTEVFKI